MGVKAELDRLQKLPTALTEVLVDLPSLSTLILKNMNTRSQFNGPSFIPNVSHLVVQRCPSAKDLFLRGYGNPRVAVNHAARVEMLDAALYDISYAVAPSINHATRMALDSSSDRPVPVSPFGQVSRSSPSGLPRTCSFDFDCSNSTFTFRPRARLFRRSCLVHP